ncbi:hypothetical protein CHS0354_033798 [Potamilus streckersoni]|uniref:lysozyme n=1 Tax=Potamilus streckersoni TaxID=2493646 RepID=A0AAE0SF39_9BIVA|nr:hypothetical protein CHS0354_033798 [Potamilus streckersoni]
MEEKPFSRNLVKMYTLVHISDSDIEYISWHACANDLECSSHCVQNYIQKYIGSSGCAHTCQSYARIHNGGPAGCTHSYTLSYWHLVQAKGCH